jgi:ABC-type branched-subunit amino acid transport system substrate-binding protein
LVLLGLIAATTVAAPGFARAQPGSVTIAVEAPFFHGIPDVANFGNAALMAIDDRGGRVCGDWNVAIERFDTGHPRSFVSLERAMATAHRAVAQMDVGALLGTFTSSAATVLLPIVNPSRLLVVSASNTSSCLTVSSPDCDAGQWYPSGVRNYARTTSHDLVQGARQADWVADLIGGAGRVVLSYRDDTYGATLASSFLASASAGLEIVAQPYDVEHPVNAVLDVVLPGILAAQPDLVVQLGFDETVPLIHGLRTQGFAGAIMIADGAFGPGIIEELGDLAEGVYATLPGIAPGSYDETAAEWAVRFTAQFGPPTGYTAEAYMAATLILDAFEDACAGGRVPTDRDAVRAAGLSTSRTHASPFGDFRIDANGDVIGGPVGGFRVERNDEDALEWVYQVSLR